MLQTMINDARPGDTVRVPAGTYEVDAVNAPITLKNGLLLDLSQATLQAKPNDQTGYKILWAKGVEDVVIHGGKIIGERLAHLVPVPPAGPAFGPDVYSGGWGMGVSITDGSRNVRVIGTHISQCFGDGLYVDWGETKQGPSNILIDGVTCIRNRRQGASIICVDGLRIRNSTFAENGLAPEGTIPGAGIDFECDPYPPPDVQYIKNVVVEGNNKFWGNRGSAIGVNGDPGIYAAIRIEPGNTFDMRTRPIWVAGGLNGRTPWWAMVLNRLVGWHPAYRWWGYPTEWSL